MSIPTWANKYRTSDEKKKLTPNQRVIELANQKVRIERVLRDLFGSYVPEEADSHRMRCPWGYEHTDGGLSKDFRVYLSTNTAMCFASVHGHYTPVKVWATEKGLTFPNAAKAMLRHYGVGMYNETYIERAIRIVEGSDHLEPVHVSKVLQQLLPTHPKYIKNQFDPEVRDYVIQWSETEFPLGEEEFDREFKKWKHGMWEILDGK